MHQNWRSAPSRGILEIPRKVMGENLWCWIWKGHQITPDCVRHVCWLRHCCSASHETSRWSSCYPRLQPSSAAGVLVEALEGDAVREVSPGSVKIRGFNEEKMELNIIDWLVVPGTWLLVFHMLGMSSSQLTFIFFRGIQTTKQLSYALIKKFGMS